jgi:hypothetical protein
MRAVQTLGGILFVQMLGLYESANNLLKKA